MAVRRYGFANGAACCAQTCGKCGGTDCEKLPGGEDNCCFHSIADPDGKKSDGSDTHGVPKCRDNNGVGPCVIDESFFVVEWAAMQQCCGPATLQSQGTSSFQVSPRGNIIIPYALYIS